MSLDFRLHSVQHSFGATSALKDISLDISHGEQVAFIGPSGSGKTTLLRLLGTQLTPSAGQVQALGMNPADLTPRELRSLRSQLGYIPQSLGLVPNLRVLQNVLNGRIGQRSFISTLRSLLFPRSSDVQAVYELLERVGISEKIYDLTDSLSGGQQQRVAIARSLFQGAQALIADEPVSAIDPTRARSTIDRMMKLSHEDGFTLMISIHNLELAKEFFPRLIGLREGRVLFDAAPENISQSEYDQLFAVHHEPS